MRRRNQKIGIVSYSSRKEEETLINKKRSSSNHKWEGRASGKREQGDHSFCRHNQPHASRKGMVMWSRVREIWANPYRVYGLGTTRIREEKPGNWKFARVKCPRKQRDSWLGVSLVGFYPNNNQILEFYCAYWSLFSRPASLSCLPGSKRKGAQKNGTRLIKI